MKTNIKRLTIIIGGTLFFLVLCMLLFYPKFQNSCDVTMNILLSGVLEGDKIVSRILFSNVAIGYVIKSMTLLFPNVAWYSVIQILACYVAIVALSYQIISKYDGCCKTLGIILCMLTNVFIGFSCYINLGYLKTTVLLVSVGWYYIFNNVETQKIIKHLIGTMFVIVGSLFSFRVFIATSILYIVFQVVWKFVLRKTNRVEWKFWLGIFIVLAVVFCFRRIDVSSYDGTENRRLQVQYRDSVEKIYAYGAPPVDLIDIEKFNLSASEYMLFSSGEFLNSGEEALSIITEIASVRRGVSFDEIIILPRRLLAHLHKNALFYGLMFLSVITVIGDKKNRWKLLGFLAGVMLISLWVLDWAFCLEFEYVYSVVLIPFFILLLTNSEYSENEIIAYRYFPVVFGLYLVIIYRLFCDPEWIVAQEGEYFAEYEEIEWEKEDYFFIDINAYTKSFSALNSKDGFSLEEYPKVIFVDGIYSLFNETKNQRNIRNFDLNNTYPWLYNPNSIDVRLLKNF